MLLGGFTAGHHVWDFVRPYLGGLRTITWEPRGLGRSARRGLAHTPAPPISVRQVFWPITPSAVSAFCRWKSRAAA